MDRRLSLVALACWPWLQAFAQDEEPRPHFRISSSELAAALRARFPVRLAMAGVFELVVDAPHLLLLPATQQLGATLQAQVRGAQLQGVETGDMDVAFRVRYEPSDRTLRVHHLQVRDLRWAGLDVETRRLLQDLVPEIARQAVGEIVLHRFTQRELALPETMGFEPETITVEGSGLLVTFAPKPVR